MGSEWFQRGNTWVAVDHRQINDLNGNSVTKIFSCNPDGSSAAFYRYIRLKQTGKTAYGSGHLLLASHKSEIAIVGIREKDIPRPHVRINRTNHEGVTER
jgi:hypothetical protein